MELIVSSFVKDMAEVSDCRSFKDETNLTGVANKRVESLPDVILTENDNKNCDGCVRLVLVRISLDFY